MGRMLKWAASVIRMGPSSDAVNAHESSKSNDKDATAGHGQCNTSFAARLEAADKEGACKLIREQEAQKRQDLEDNFKKQQAEMLAEHQATVATSEAMLARRNADDKQFKYIARGCKGELASGSVPRQIFQGEPASALAKIYDGTWQYAQDAEGRALVNSNPLHWPLILDWLSFGAVPERPTKAFIAECTYWQLDKLLAAMETRQDEKVRLVEASGDLGHRFEVSKATMRGKWGFNIKGQFHNFVPRFLDTPGTLLSPHVKFDALGGQWMLKADKQGIMIHLQEGPELKGQRMILKVGDDTCAFTWETQIQHLYGKGHDGYGFRLNDPTHQEPFTHPKHVALDGSLSLSFTLLFA